MATEPTPAQEATLRADPDAEVVFVETMLACLPGLEARGVTLETLAARSGMPPHQLTRGRNRMSWNQYVEGMSFVSATVGGAQGLRRLGQGVEDNAYSQGLARVARAFTSVRFLYQAFVRWVWPMFWPDLRYGLEVLGPASLRLSVSIPEPLRPCPAWFHMARGVLERAPRLLYFEASVVDLKVDAEGRHGAFEIAHAPSVTLWSWMVRIAEALTRPTAVIDHQMAQVAELNDKLRALSEAQRAAERALEVEERFLTNISHELRTPLTAAVGFTEMARDEGPNEDILNEVQGAHRDLLRKVEILIDHSQLVRGELELANERFVLGAVFENLESDLRGLAERRGLAIEFDVSTRLDVVPRVGDGPRIYRILHELVRNAITFTLEGSVEVSARVEDDELVVVIRDTGPGLPESISGLAKQAFRQADDSLTRAHEGLGLGLPLAAALIRSMKGAVRIQTSNEGTTFIIEIPLITAPALAARSSRGAREVLVVDDNRLNRKILSRLVARRGLRAVEAEDGTQALQRVEEARPALILMDCQMPVMDGLEATRRLRETEAGRDLPIVAVTAHGQAGYADLCHKAGMDIYLTKPVDQKLLDEVLALYIAEE